MDDAARYALAAAAVTAGLLLVVSGTRRAAGIFAGHMAEARARGR